MELIPAIDLLGGRVVRLVQGDLARQTEYSDDPVAIARMWVGQGASRLHIVDLDGSRAGRPVQSALVSSVVAAAGVPCQVAGGLRDEAAVESALRAGADRVVLGTALLRDPELGRHLVALHGAERIVAAIDVRDGIAHGMGWSGAGERMPAIDILRRLHAAGVAWFAVTSIARDGLLEGPDLELLDAVTAAAPGARFIASGGIGTLEDVRALAARAVDEAILGRALYERRIDLRDASAVAASVGVKSDRQTSAR